MASTRDIKRRIKGVSSTRQITKAMELVSSSKLRKARGLLERSKPYYENIYTSMQELLSTIGRINHPLLIEREIKNTLYIVITSDRGLAGGYNGNINRLVEDMIGEDKSNSKLITIGQKAYDYFKRRDYNIVDSFFGISEEPQFSDAQYIAKLAVEMYEKKEVDQVFLVYSEFITTISQKPKGVKLLPQESKAEKGQARSIIEFEPSMEEVLDYLIPKFVESITFGALIEASVSEQAARRVAMEAASDNADELIEDLNMRYNRARQAAITMEISEIVSGADAL